MAIRLVRCKYCHKQWKNKDLNLVAYGNYYFCDLGCLNDYKHIKNDNCCIHKDN